MLTRGGVRVEVKASGYLQAWRQRRQSRIEFTGLRGRVWDDDTGRSASATYNADVYVFAVQTATNHYDYDPLDVPAMVTLRVRSGFWSSSVGTVR